MRRLSKSLLLVLIVAGLPVGATPDIEGAGEASARLSRRLADLHSLDAAFTQTTVDTSDRILQETEGHLWVASPNQFRIETDDPFRQTLVSDGKSFWSFDADLEQVIIRDMDRNIQQVPILLLGGEPDAILATYTVHEIDGDASQVFVLQPKSASNLFESLGIEFAGDRPRTITLVDGLGQLTRIVLGKTMVNAEVDPVRFHFETPDGVDVIDDRIPD